MKPSEKAIEAAFNLPSIIGGSHDHCRYMNLCAMIEAAYAIDVDPLIEQLNEEITDLKEVRDFEHRLAMQYKEIVEQKDKEIERLKKLDENPLSLIGRIAALEQEIERLKIRLADCEDCRSTSVTYGAESIAALEQENAKLLEMLKEAELDLPGTQMDISEFLKNRLSKSP